MSKNIKFSVLYLLDGLNSAIVESDMANWLFNGDTKELNEIDAYRLAQIRLLNPRIVPVSIEHLRFHSWEHEIMYLPRVGNHRYVTLGDYISIKIAELSRKDVKWALQLMDPDLSIIYRKQLKSLLVKKLKMEEKGIRELEMSLYSRTLPKKFDPSLAIQFLPKNAESLREIFEHLRENSRLISMFTTSLRSLTDFNEIEWADLHEQLEAKGAYYQFSLAMRTSSNVLFNLTSEYLIATLKPFTSVLMDLLPKVKSELIEVYDLQFNESEDPLKYFFKKSYPYLHVRSRFYGNMDAVRQYIRHESYFEQGAILIVKEFWINANAKDSKRLIFERLKEDIKFLAKANSQETVEPALLVACEEAVEHASQSGQWNGGAVSRDWLIANCYLCVKNYELAALKVHRCLIRHVNYSKMFEFELNLKLAICYKENKPQSAARLFRSCINMIYDWANVKRGSRVSFGRIELSPEDMDMLRLVKIFYDDAFIAETDKRAPSRKLPQPQQSPVRKAPGNRVIRKKYGSGNS